MTLNESVRYVDGVLYCDDVAISDIVAVHGTPTYVYSLKRVIENYRRLKTTFSKLDVHIHYSAKANANRAILQTLIRAGAGIDAVSGGEIFLALDAGVDPADIVYAGVGKTVAELRYALEQQVGWINVENVAECDIINQIASSLGRRQKIALRLNPDVTATTHPYIATGHGAAKFGLISPVVRNVLERRSNYPFLNFAGLHVHIGSQLHDVGATRRAVEQVLQIANDYDNLTSINIGGGFPAAYHLGEQLPDLAEFARKLEPLLASRSVILEPGRSIVADAGLLVTQLLYTKEQGGQMFYVVDGSMTDLIRPALYQATHEIVPLVQKSDPSRLTQVVGPVCETADTLGRDILLPELHPGDGLVILTAGAYGSVMSSNYNARLRPAEVMVSETGDSWQLAVRRETFADLTHRLH